LSGEAEGSASEHQRAHRQHQDYKEPSGPVCCPYHGARIAQSKLGIILPMAIHPDSAGTRSQAPISSSSVELYARQLGRMSFTSAAFPRKATTTRLASR
jgi:hypothetical protein